MNQLSKGMKRVLYTVGALLILGGWGLMGWLGIKVMLYGGIMAAINNWETNNSATVWGIIRAFLFEFGLIPGAFMVLWGVQVIQRVYASGYINRIVAKTLRNMGTHR